MAKRAEREGAIGSELSPKARWIGFFGACLIRMISGTLRWRLHDPSGVATAPPENAMIWTFWHNRIFTLPAVYHRYLKTRKGAVLTSASRDGEIIAAVVARFGCAAVRGSSSRRGIAALLGLKEAIQNGYDVAIVPDGPRGPRYRLGPGAVKLAELTGAAILPVRVEYGSAWVFQSWDRFQLPKPFTTVDVFLGPCTFVSSGLDEEGFEGERLRIEQLMNPANETD
jgi:lysophospholipid acyltransferase (LPLAT)-like uncharacterized protein